MMRRVVGGGGRNWVVACGVEARTLTKLREVREMGGTERSGRKVFDNVKINLWEGCKNVNLGATLLSGARVSVCYCVCYCVCHCLQPKLCYIVLILHSFVS